uniref:Uncharacterized protein n=1 Tax=candidate division CPR3 bacterium TaxID=2268181 RepID=A0A7C4R8Q2_UNCC3
MENQIKKIFKTRDEAVIKNDLHLFLSTQTGEIAKSGSEGYLKTGKLVSTVLHVHNDNQDPNLWVVLVQEDYFFDGNFSHRSYLLYKIVKQNKKMLIAEIVW